jgi:hypothetical protein
MLRGERVDATSLPEGVRPLWPSAADGDARCRWLTHNDQQRAEAARVGGTGGGLRSNHRGNVGGMPGADLEYSEPVLMVGASRGTVVAGTGTSALTIGR